MSSEKTSILLIGATGYIGGSILSRLLDHPRFPTFSLSAIIRSPEKAKELQALKVNTVLGSFSDQELVQNLASEADIVVNAADADNLEASLAILRGAKQRFEKTQTPTTLIHTSGTGVLTDDARGMYSTDTIFDDLDPDMLETLAPTQLHRNVDLALLQGDKDGYVRTYIVLPSTIYGLAKTKLVEMGIQNRRYMQIPQIIRASIGRGQGGMVGEGRNIWPNVHIDDIADLYLTLLDAILEGRHPGHGREGFYFGENGEHTLYDVSKRISEILVDRGLGRHAEPFPFTEEEADKYLEGSYYLGTNSRCRANRARALGWKPKHTTQDLLASLPAEVDATIAEI